MSEIISIIRKRIRELEEEFNKYDFKAKEYQKQASVYKCRAKTTKKAIQEMEEALEQFGQENTIKAA
jgi:hypothetical protein